MSARSAGVATPVGASTRSMWRSRPWLAGLNNGRAISSTIWLAALTACFSNTISEPADLVISLTASPTSATVGETIVFRFSASGPFLVTVTVDFGDEMSDVTDAQGAQTAVGNVPHAYAAAGSYRVTATARGVDGAAAADTLSVQITAGSADRMRSR